MVSSYDYFSILGALIVVSCWTFYISTWNFFVRFFTSTASMIDNHLVRFQFAVGSLKPECGQLEAKLIFYFGYLPWVK